MALLTSVFCTSTSTPQEASTCDSSSTTNTALKNVEPAPPHCSGTSMPMIPSSKKLEMSDLSIAASWSILATSGRIFSVAKSRTLSANICSSSDRTVRGVAAGSSVAVVMTARILSRAHGGDEVAEIGVFLRHADGPGEVVVGALRIDLLRGESVVRGLGMASQLCLDQRGI